MAFGMFGDIFNLALGNKGWQEGGLQTRSLNSPAQQSLMQPLADWYQQKLSSSPTDFLHGEFGQQYFNSLLGPSFNDYMSNGIPAINTQFSGINGIFNTRRNQAIQQGLTSLYNNAQSQYIQAIPSLYNMQFLPADKASAFATQQTQQTVKEDPGTFKQFFSSI